jgi:preprotein translocase subunit YajC
MNDTTDIMTLTMRVAIFVVIAGIFYFILRSPTKK